MSLNPYNSDTHCSRTIGPYAEYCDSPTTTTSDFSHTAVANLITQRNAIQMLHDRMRILLEYVSAVINSEISTVSFSLGTRKLMWD